MKYRDFAILIGAAAVGALVTVGAQRAAGPRSFEDCVLENIRSDSGARGLVTAMCRTKFPIERRWVPVDYDPFAPISDR